MHVKVSNNARMCDCVCVSVRCGIRLHLADDVSENACGDGPTKGICAPGNTARRSSRDPSSQVGSAVRARALLETIIGDHLVNRPNVFFFFASWRGAQTDPI